METTATIEQALEIGVRTLEAGIRGKYKRLANDYDSLLSDIQIVVLNAFSDFDGSKSSLQTYIINRVRWHLMSAIRAPGRRKSQTFLMSDVPCEVSRTEEDFSDIQRQLVSRALELYAEMHNTQRVRFALMREFKGRYTALELQTLFASVGDTILNQSTTVYRKAVDE